MAATMLPSVHPHGRGEHFTTTLEAVLSTGSSPRAWGTYIKESLKRVTQRFIPTGVGNIARSRRERRAPSVHPHGRGEHRIEAAQNEGLIGSSPRAWGTLTHGFQQPPRHRFIPTGVGNIRSLSGNRPAPTGSSPRAWGTFTVTKSGTDEDRFIPTGVGNMVAERPAEREIAVHPHGRGEHDRKCGTMPPP